MTRKIERTFTLSIYADGMHYFSYGKMTDAMIRRGDFSFGESLAPLHSMIDDVASSTRRPLPKLGSKVKVTMELIEPSKRKGSR